MPKNPGQKKKLLLIKKIFEERTDEGHTVTVDAIIDILDNEYMISAERKSVKEDIDTLIDMGEDICYRNHGPQKHYFLASRLFEGAELKLLADCVQSSRFITQRKSAELIRKIESLTSVHEAKELQRQIYVTGKVKTMNESIYYTVDAIQRAMGSGKAVCFRYFDYNENKEKILRHDKMVYTVSPWALISNEDNYYLRAYDHTERILKNFRVDKMTDVNVSDESRQGQSLYEKTDPEKYTQRTFGMYSDEEMLVTLHFHKSLCGVMVDRFGKDVTFFKTNTPEIIQISVNVNLSNNFLGWIMCFGNRIKIVAPEAAVKKMVQLSGDVLKMYTDEK